MPQKSQTRGSPKKTEKPRNQKEQSERFIETARKIGVDERGTEFDRVLTKIVASKKGR